MSDLADDFIDFWCRPDPENWERCKASLAEVLAAERAAAVAEAMKPLAALAAADNEATSFPWWAITTRALHGETVHAGPYFSRESAEAYMEAHRYRYPKSARVFCFSGHESPAYRDLYEKARAQGRLPLPPAPGEGA
ncbi:MAG: hypothetical protein AB7I13_10470 [Vicinamibacterales bacterium]